jgi:hypothetical protein
LAGISASCEVIPCFAWASRFIQLSPKCATIRKTLKGSTWSDN